jgi:lysophospholipase L1-like esterase|tara:strand:- start:117 stop:803 length:687 start_codon:yes stop_codon:yes gene_type:complete
MKEKKKLILLGDSVFDNAVYLQPDQQSVTQHLISKLESTEWQAHVHALDKTTTETIQPQYGKADIDSDTPSNIILSVGGNDALQYIESLDKLNLETLYTIKEKFWKNYTTVVNALANSGHQVYLCTIYNPKFPDPFMQRKVEAGLSIFNDVILTAANELWEDYQTGMPTLIPNKYVEGYINNIIGAKYPLIDLRSVCYDDECFANPIEPSEYGGDKITDEIINKVLDN